jgi:hypothetical protein
VPRSIASVPVVSGLPNPANPNPGSSRRAGARSNGKNLRLTATAVGGLFFPQTRSLGIDQSAYSPALQAKIVYAGTNNTSYEQGQADLRELAEIDVSDKQVRRVCKGLGAERCDERDAAAAAYQALPLVQRKEAPAGVTAPKLAVVGVDGGRLQIFDRAAAAEKTETATAELAEADDHPDERTENGRHWREDKIGLLMTMTSDVHEADPCPEIPENFINPLRIMKLARELKKQVPPGDEAAKPPTDHDEPETEIAEEWERPEVKSKHLVASRRPWENFGPLVATRAWQCGFYAAERKAFIADGAGNNWTLWRSHFSSFTPILDFIHALSYIFAAATTGQPFADGWAVYKQWITWAWQGHIDRVLTDLESRQAELGQTKEEAAGSARQVVARALEYLRNNQERMKYAEYRRQGLPMMSCYVESAVKQFNYRVKGTEKFWDEEGAEEMLQLRADLLSDDKPMAAFWERRQKKSSGQRRYRKSA